MLHRLKSQTSAHRQVQFMLPVPTWAPNKPHKQMSWIEKCFAFFEMSTSSTSTDLKGLCVDNIQFLFLFLRLWGKLYFEMYSCWQRALYVCHYWDALTVQFPLRRTRADRQRGLLVLETIFSYPTHAGEELLHKNTSIRATEEEEEEGGSMNGREMANSFSLTSSSLSLSPLRLFVCPSVWLSPCAWPAVGLGC